MSDPRRSLSARSSSPIYPSRAARRFGMVCANVGMAGLEKRLPHAIDGPGAGLWPAGDDMVRRGGAGTMRVLVFGYRVSVKCTWRTCTGKSKLGRSNLSSCRGPL